MLVCLFVFPKANTAGLLIELSSLGWEDCDGSAFRRVLFPSLA